jgi:hypothetical protein
MRAMWNARNVESLGIGQSHINERWWVWQEMQLPTRQLDRLIDTLGAPELAAYVSVRQWTFDTVLDGQTVSIRLGQLMRSGLTAEMAAEELRAAGRRFDQIIRRVTVGPR